MNALNSRCSNSRAKCHKDISLSLSKYDYEGSFQPAPPQPISTKKENMIREPLSTPRGGEKNECEMCKYTLCIISTMFFRCKKESYIL